MLVTGYVLTPLLANIGLWLALIVFVFARGVVLAIDYPKIISGTQWQ